MTSPAAQIDPAGLRVALEQVGERHGPGLFGLVLQDGDVVFEHAMGVAELDSARPMTGDDQVRIGSLTKTYVAALVLLLESEGLLATADPLQRWLPGLIPGGEEITLETLLRLRSGLPDYLEPLMGSPPDLGALERYWAPEQLVELALAAPGRIAPNIEYRYWNLDFVLLGLVVERATRQRVEAQLWQRFFEPLGLTDTTFPTVDPRLRGRHADGHLRLGPSAPFIECTTMSPSQAFTAGAIVSTPREVAVFFDALLEGRVLPTEVLSRMTEGRDVLGADARRGLGIPLLRHYPDGTVVFGAPPWRAVPAAHHRQPRCAACGVPTRSR